ncbi:hypothetical protein GCM10023115_00840 [Pontixanthobacter gangjinensis]|uniref:Cytochrome c family protein n=1 Tax=Pontixanthobacter gangjinensis TaxID=1028742 RepID=A0A6I4SI63_9SPHN|nr:hypothetical protein [Pontixanthobacter gangjinensis]MXO55339.1 hypothetical protein [Pontixanthobacter gangjinensis]
MSKLKTIGAVGAAISLLAAVSGCRNTENAEDVTIASGPINPVIDNCNTTGPVLSSASISSETANSGLPCTVGFGDITEFNLANLQIAFDFNSWLTFVALNKKSGDSIEWQGWQDLGSLMLADGAAPPPFGEAVPAPEICTGGAKGAPVLQMISKTPITPTASISGEPLNTGPLIDQNGKYARYQILVNEPMYNYIVANDLYSRAGQAAFSDEIEFPAGKMEPDGKGVLGAIVLKVSWKVMGEGDDPAAFQSVTGYVYTPASQGEPATCVTEQLGLVGMHIVHKTDAEPQWLWGSFEHVANVPDTPTSDGHFNFYNPSCSDCDVNTQPPQPWSPSVEPFPGDFRSQIMRTTTYPKEALDSAGRWNSQFQAALGNSVLANYKLVTTQWPTDAKSKTDPSGAPFPLFAANSTMETYVQATRSGNGWINTPQATSSCMACHNNATTTDGKESDFSFVLEKAQ